MQGGSLIHGKWLEAKFERGTVYLQPDVGVFRKKISHTVTDTVITLVEPTSHSPPPNGFYNRYCAYRRVFVILTNFQSKRLRVFRIVIITVL